MKRPRLKAMASRTGSLAGSVARTALLSAMPFNVRRDEVVVMVSGLALGSAALRRRVTCRDARSQDSVKSAP